MPRQPHRHPVFARVYDRLARSMERELADERRELLSGLTGRVIEIGAGNGMNFRHYPSSVQEVVALEPEPYLRARAQEAARVAPVPVVVVEGVAERLPADLADFDAAVSCLVLCSVGDQARALAELRRVLRPSGELRFLEHVRAASPRKARVQDALDRSRAWPAVAGGCHCARDTVAAIGQAGFVVGDVRFVDVGVSWLHTNPHAIGVARATRHGPSQTSQPPRGFSMAGANDLAGCGYAKRDSLQEEETPHVATQVKESFNVSNADSAWSTLTDINKLIPCVPGAKVTSADSPTKANAEIDVKMGSMGMKFSGPVEIVEQDASAKRAVIKASAKEAAGQSNAEGTVTIQIGGDGGTVEGTANVSGKAASMGEGTIQAVLKQLVSQFGNNLGKA